MTRGTPIDHTDQRYGRLTALRKAHGDGNGQTFWLCRCDCGKEVFVRGAFLRSRQRFCSKQCPLLGEHARTDIAGTKFGRLTALAYVGKTAKGGKAIWRYVCDCGNEVARVADNVRSENIQSCGCLGTESRIRHGQSGTREYHRAAHRKWSAENRSKCIANANKRRADYRLRIPCWLTDDDWEKIEAVYQRSAQLSRDTGILHHVDHIYPLRGKTVSGLHVPWNLQAIPYLENLQKSRKMPDDIC